jgi:hypothetical protein
MCHKAPSNWVTAFLPNTQTRLESRHFGYVRAVILLVKSLTRNVSGMIAWRVMPSTGSGAASHGREHRSAGNARQMAVPGAFRVKL